MKTTFNLALAAALAAALMASPADAQGRGNGQNRDRDRDRQEQRDRDRDRDDDDDDDDDVRPRFERRRDDDRRYDDRVYSQQQRRVPPGWCRGRGNPHNTAENCRYNSRHDRWERYDSRTGRYETYTYSRNRDRNDSGSYEASHREFHYSHDRQCRERAAQRPLDVRWQIQVRSECKSIHDDFHRRWGTPHR
jgi:hypothetical protein